MKLPMMTTRASTQPITPQSEEQKRSTWEQQVIKQLGESEDVTGAVHFLTSDDATFISGPAIVIDGGQYRIGCGESDDRPSDDYLG
jgi:NAD(P)-dependent dehydrogenase (short-subunit alcohol dehydrogenase family)